MANSPKTENQQSAADFSEPWEPVEGETDKAFHAFTIYRSLHPFERSHRLVTERLGKTNGYIRIVHGWASKYNWTERALAWDAHLARQLVGGQEAAHRAELEAFRLRLHRMNQKALARCEQVLDLCDVALAKAVVVDAETGDLHVVISPDRVPAFLRAAAAVGNMAVEAGATMFGVDEVLQLTAPEPEDRDP